MKNTINIIHVAKLAGVGKKSGNAYDMRLAQCIIELTDEAGNPAPLIGELVLPEKFKETAPGRYEVTFEVMVDSNKRVGSRVASMTPIVRSAPAAPKAAA